MDDDPAVLKALSRLLRTHSFQARTFVSGKELLAALPTGLPQCLIVDLQMPEMNGLELHQHLVSNGITIPTILISAHDSVALSEHKPAFVANLRKPLQERVLFEAIEKAIGTRNTK
ncbi:response regulator [Bradyrhizobium sp. 2S1]|uniref:response regulator n=1 Tax=Bradyrhizobium sp. 2S1 TaxID=1404429 RepID=UPI002004131F|nr:response regulator [Bradyrhizobium sp. 2S1]MCK7674072.1 response regulator [Bradyrhizobium sp. 2S1]